ncbi:MAG: sulfite exporter TauE/SafE family protein [Polyangiaceae bacterium]|jgi:uncharacterized protein
MSAVLLASALVMGLLGSTHCVVMCGGVVAMTCSALPLARRRRFAAQLPYLLSYNAGRISSYAGAGAVAGGLGSSLAALGLLWHAELTLRLAAALMMLAVGLYIAGVSRALRWVERAAAPVWRGIAPAAQRLVPIRHPLSAWALGLVWGWMPCGLVYAALAAAVTSGSALGGAATMAAFGVGTLPMLMAMGSAGAAIARMARVRMVRVAAGAAMVALGLLQIVHVSQAWADAGSPTVHACCPNHRT